MYARHEGICRVLSKLLKNAEIPHKWETRGLISDSKERPADIYLPVSNNGQPEAIDVTVTHCCNTSSHTAALADPETVQIQKAAVDTKRKHYTAKLEPQGIVFTAFALDVYGQLHSDAVRVLERIATYASVNKGGDYGKLLWSFRVQVQAALAKQVVQMIQVRG